MALTWKSGYFFTGAFFGAVVCLCILVIGGLIYDKYATKPEIKPDSPIVAPEEDVNLIPTKLTIHTAKGAVSYYPAPKSENEGDGLKYWFYPNDADIYAISVSCEKEGE